MSLSISDDAIKLIVTDIGKILVTLEGQEDIRYSLALLPELASKLKSAVDLNDTPENRWISYIIVDQLGNLQSGYDGKPQEWYKLNAKNIDQLRKLWKSYFENLGTDLSGKDYAKIIDDTKTFFFFYWRLRRERTMVPREP